MTPARDDIQAASWQALGTSVHLLTVGSDLSAATRVVNRLLDDVDRTYSRFRPDSELSRLNAASGRPVRVSPLLATAIEAALRAGRLSDGLVDPTVGRAMRLIGYDDDFSRAAAKTAPLSLRFAPIPGWQTIEFDAGAATVRLPRGVELDLGSTGKALASDLAAKAAFAATGRGGVMVSLGGDIATAGTAPATGWRVLAAEDSRTPTSADGEVIAMPGGALATSGTTVRRWTRGGVRLHHLIDPRTGLPAAGPWRTVTVIAGTCVDANIAATAAIVRGPSAVDWLRDLGLAARLVSSHGQVRRVGTWPQPLSAIPGTSWNRQGQEPTLRP